MDELPAVVAAQDQELADAAHTAQCIARFWTELVTAGITDDLLDVLTERWATYVLGSWAESDEGPPLPEV